MKREDYKTIEKMIGSSDKESFYMGLTILRNDPNKRSKQILKKISIFDRITSYVDVCLELGIKELTEEDFNFLPIEQRRKSLAQYKIQNLEKLFNGDWQINWKDNSQYKYFPYFTIDGSSRLVFLSSDCPSSHFDGAVGFYKDEKTSDFIGTKFTHIYQDLI